MKKNEFARRMAEKMDTHEAVAEMWLDTVVETLYESLKRGESVTITHLGSFYVKKRLPPGYSNSTLHKSCAPFSAGRQLIKAIRNPLWRAE